MARRVRDKGLESRSARAKLKASGKPYYKAIGEGLHLGYRKGATVGKWVARIYVGDQKYEVQTIATADDYEDADGQRILTFWQAQDRARELAGKKVYTGPFRVRDAVEAYLNYLGDRTTAYDGRIRFEKHILPVLGDTPLGELAADQIRNWHRELARSLPLTPRKRGGVQTREVDFSDPEQVRRRRVSANRVLSILKAALNRAFKDGKVDSDKAWRRVDPFENVERSRNRYLTLAECQRLLNVAEEDFRLLLRGALETGARYGELCRLECGDYNRDSGTIHIRKSKSGKERHIVLTDDGREFFDQLSAGRPAASPMFGRQWKPAHQFRRMRRACEAARLDPPVGIHQLRHTYCSLSVMAGMPLMVLAKNLGHVDTRMVEKHYGHLSDSFVADQVRKHAPRFGKVGGNVKAIR
jgi:integrase